MPKKVKEAYRKMHEYLHRDKGINCEHCKNSKWYYRIWTDWFERVVYCPVFDEEVWRLCYATMRYLREIDPYAERVTVHDQMPTMCRYYEHFNLPKKPSPFSHTLEEYF